MQVSWSELYWQRLTPLHAILWPASLLLELSYKLKRAAYRYGLFSTSRYPIPLILVDSITVNGIDKSALIVWLVNFLTSNGLRPAVISCSHPDGYQQLSAEVTSSSDIGQVGDTALFLAFHCNKYNCPVWIGQDNGTVGLDLLKIYPDRNILICDDGLHDYHLFRDLEILVLDTDKYYYGNGFTLPAGPLRDNLTRLNCADAVVLHEKNQQSFDQVDSSKIYYAKTSSSKFINFYHASDHFKKITTSSNRLHAIAGTKYAKSFFDQLSYLNLAVSKQSILNESQFTKRYIDSLNTDIILIKEEDAVKCLSVIDDRFWILKESIVANTALQVMLLNKLREKFMDTKLLDILVCPLCKGSLVYKKIEKELICKRDRLAFPIRDGIPIMLEDGARLLPPEEEV